jgi:hypothetical protein
MDMSTFEILLKILSIVLVLGLFFSLVRNVILAIRA